MSVDKHEKVALFPLAEVLNFVVKRIITNLKDMSRLSCFAAGVESDEDDFFLMYYYGVMGDYICDYPHNYSLRKITREDIYEFDKITKHSQDRETDVKQWIKELQKKYDLLSGYPVPYGRCTRTLTH